MWRGGVGLAYLFPALSFAVASYPDRAPFAHPAHQAEHADFPHPLTPAPSDLRT
jgi:hypothetical protein